MWADKALTESDAKKQVEAMLALARAAGVCPQHRTDSTPPVDSAMRDKILAVVLAIDLANLDATSQLTVQRSLQVILNRFSQPDDATAERLIAAIDPLFPSESAELNWLLCDTLAWLQSPTLVKKAIALIEAAPTQEEQVQYARSIRMLKTGWTDEPQTVYFEWFLKAANYRGGASFEKFFSSSAMTLSPHLANLRKNHSKRFSLRNR